MRLLFFLLFLVCFNTGFSQQFRVFIEQDNLKKEILYNDSIITLKKKPFTIEIHLIRLEIIYASASYDSLYYGTPLGQNFKDWEYIGAKGMAEDSFNIERRLVLGYEEIHHWFYDTTETWHRFERDIKINGDTVIGKKTIDKFLSGYDDWEDIPISSIKQPIFMVFFAKDYTPGNGNKELDRKKTVLIFR